MPSPFPGVDPYVEAQGHCETFHARFVTYCGDALNEVLPWHYAADISERLYPVDLASEDPKQIIPDVLVAQQGRASVAGSRRAKRSGGTALLDPVKVPLPHVKVERRTVWIEISRLPKGTPSP